MPVKKGLNRIDQSKLKTYVEKGFPVEKIAYALNTTENVVQSFLPKPESKKKVKAKKIAVGKKPDNPNLDTQTEDA